MLVIALALLLLIFVYPYIIYPALLYIHARIVRRKIIAADVLGTLPSVAIVICALNEERIIGQKLENCLSLQYPGKKPRIIVVSDGSTDHTADVVRNYLISGIELFERDQRRGKIANLNEVIPQLQEDIVILSDANVMYRSDAVMKLIARFKDPSVGCISGRVILTDSTPELDGPTGQYYSLEWFIQERSSEIYSMAGADGAMYALRRSLFRHCPSDTIIEDFVIPMDVIRQHLRVVHEPEAIGWEKGSTTVAEEFGRKVRIAAGVAQGLIRGNILPNIDAPLRFWFVFVSHKLLRWFSPLVGLAILCCTLLAIQEPEAQIVLVGIGLLVSLGLVQLLTRWGNPVVSAPFYFLFGQVALACGLVKGFMGQQSVLWAKENR
jgi:cellulose synthase/poly-beta-1,6-N-acetylglucosamine synthase-like glycosyltransferase